MTQSWPEVPIKEVYLGLFDGPHATPPTSNEGPVFLGIGNVTEDGHIDLAGVRHISESDYPTWTRRVTPTAGDIVFTYEATLNRYAIVPAGFRGCLGRRMALIRPDPSKIDTRFLHYTFFAPEWRSTIERYRLAGATVDRIPLTKFPDFPVRLPPLPTQRKIAAILSAYDDLIENNTRRVQVLEQMARDLYREWFVEFRFPGHETAEFVEDEHGRRPEGWAYASVSSLILRRKNGNVYKKELITEIGSVPVIDQSRSEILGYHEFTPDHLATADKPVAIFGDHTCKLEVINRDFSLGPNTIAFMANPATACLYQLFFTIESAVETQEYKRHWNDLMSKIILSPPLGLAEAFDGHIKASWELATSLKRRNQILRRTRDLLLPKLVSGELDVSALDVRGPGLEPVDVTEQTPEAVA